MGLGAGTTALLDHAWPRFRQRLVGLTDEEHLWEPVPGCWSVREGVVDDERPRPVPAPVATIAWRTWHLASDTIDRFSRLLFDHPVLPFEPGTPSWFDRAEASVLALDRAWGGLAVSIQQLDERGFEQQLGPAFGPMAAATRGDALLHVADELIGHTAAVGLLRDLYARRDQLGGR